MRTRDVPVRLRAGAMCPWRPVAREAQAALVACATSLCAHVAEASARSPLPLIFRAAAWLPRTLMGVDLTARSRACRLGACRAAAEARVCWPNTGPAPVRPPSLARAPLSLPGGDAALRVSCVCCRHRRLHYEEGAQPPYSAAPVRQHVMSQQRRSPPSPGWVWRRCKTVLLLLPNADVDTSLLTPWNPQVYFNADAGSL